MIIYCPNTRTGIVDSLSVELRLRLAFAGVKKESVVEIKAKGPPYARVGRGYDKLSVIMQDVSPPEKCYIDMLN